MSTIWKSCNTSAKCFQVESLTLGKNHLYRLILMFRMRFIYHKDTSMDLCFILTSIRERIFIYVIFRILIIIFLRYESLVRDPESVIRPILRAIGVPWDSAVLEFHSTNRSVHTNSQSRKCIIIYLSFIGIILLRYIGFIYYSLDLIYLFFLSILCHRHIIVSIHRSAP